MTKLMKADLYRIFKSPVIYIAFLLSALMTTLCIMSWQHDLFSPEAPVHYETYVDSDDFSYYIDPDLDNDDSTKPDKAIDSVVGLMQKLPREKISLAREIVGTNINFYPILLIVFAFLVSDFSNKTIKNTIGMGVSRGKYFISKLALIEIATVVLAFYTSIYTYYMSSMLNPDFYVEPLENIIYATINQIPLLMGTAAMLTMLGVMVKKMSVFLFIGVAAIFFLPTLIYLTYFIYGNDHLKLFLFKYEQHIAMMWLAYLPPMNYVLTCAAIGVGEIAVSAALGYFVLKKSEI